MLIFLIDPNDEQFKIDSGDCVDECVSTLVTSNIKLHYHNQMIDLADPAHHKLVLHFSQDEQLFTFASCVMSGEVISFDKNTFQVSFGGLIGEFRLKDDQTQSLGLTAESVLSSRQVYLYIS